MRSVEYFDFAGVVVFFVKMCQYFRTHSLAFPLPELISGNESAIVTQRRLAVGRPIEYCATIKGIRFGSPRKCATLMISEQTTLLAGIWVFIDIKS